jgi:hypothetical protein
MMYPSLRLMLAEDYDEMEQKTARRLLRQEREQQAFSSWYEYGILDIFHVYYWKNRFGLLAT